MILNLCCPPLFKNDFFDINFVETYAIFVQKGGFVSEF